MSRIRTRIRRLASPNGASNGSEHGSSRRSDAEPALEAATRLESQGDLFGAIELLTAAAQQQRDPQIERRLVGLRHRAFSLLDLKPPPGAWPPEFDDPFPGTAGRPPETDRNRLDANLIGGGLTHHGCLLVRSLLTKAQVDEAVAGIDRAFAEFDAQESQPSAPTDNRWFDPFDPPGTNLSGLRGWTAKGRGLWVGDSPPMLFSLLQALGDAGALRAVEQFFGERPAMSLQKSTLRCMPRSDRVTTWHQDGAFFDKGIRTVNIWIALSSCGGDSDVPGLDIFPRRFPGVLETGNSIAGPIEDGQTRNVPHAISFELADRLAEEAPPCRPVFNAGDALLFDELMPHKTGISPGMTRDRYAIETWLFAPSSFPKSYLPLVC